MRTRMRTGAAVAAAVLFITIVLAGCTGPSSSDVASVQEGGDTQRQTAAPQDTDPVKWAECMREHGVDVPDPEPGQATGIQTSDDASREEVDAAMKACEQFLPAGGEPIPLTAEELAQMRKFSECMRENGLEEFPDPTADGGISFQGRSDKGGGLDPRSEEFRNAEVACQQYQPVTPPGAQTTDVVEG